MESWDVVVVGAGACGLLAARELARAGKKVCILEARDRLGGRIATLDAAVWGYPAQLGAEFVHGEAKITKALIAEAGLSFTSFKLQTNDSAIDGLDETPSRSLMPPQQKLVAEKLRALKEDMPLRAFLEKSFPGRKFDALRDQIVRRAEGYDAADADRVSTFAIRDEWLLEDQWQHGRIKEGYGALVDFLADDCEKSGVEIRRNRRVTKIALTDTGAQAEADDIYETAVVVITVPLPLIAAIVWQPPIPKKLRSVEQIGYGAVIKILIRFSRIWWSNETFFFSDERIPTWWTQHPDDLPVLTGWLAGPRALQLKNAGDDEILMLALASLSRIFKMPVDELRQTIAASHVANWQTDPYAQGAYSYATAQTRAARTALDKPIDDKIFFAGEALYSGKDMATVEGAFGSGLETAARILRGG